MMNEVTDQFENPLYDALLKYVHENVDTFMAELQKDWPTAVLEEYRNKYPDLPAAPDKPPPEVVSIIWQNELRSSVYQGNDEDRRKLIKQPLGYVDMSIVHFEHLLTEEFGIDEQVSWCVSRSHQPSVLHLMCRPALSGFAKVLREINTFRNRINEEQYERQQIGTEYYGILTCNPDYEDIAHSQGICYVCYDQEEL